MAPIRFLFDYLESKSLFLPEPQKWEDENDSEVLRIYSQKKGLTSLRALCFTSVNETIHHWKSFSWGASGCCIQFSYEAVQQAVSQESSFVLRPVLYKTNKDLRGVKVPVDDFPFVKRKLFEVEHEYRLISQSTDVNAPDQLKLDLSAIQRITLSFDLPDRTLELLKRQIVDRYQVPRSKIFRSTLLKNNEWISHFSRKVSTP